jgi:hypothetical protein
VVVGDVGGGAAEGGGVTQAQFERLGREWQRRLLLDQWKIEWKAVENDVINNDRDLGNCWWDGKTLEVTVCVAVNRPRVQVERTLIHELLHLAIAPLAWTTYQLADKLGSEAHDLMDDIICAQGERVVRCLERVVMEAHRDGEGGRR